MCVAFLQVFLLWVLNSQNCPWVWSTWASPGPPCLLKVNTQKHKDVNFIPVLNYFLHEYMFVVSCRCEQPLSGSLCQPGCRFHPHTPRPVGKLAERRRPAGERHLPSFCHIQCGDKLMCWVCLSRCLMCLCFLHRTCTVSWVTQTVWRLWICPTATALWSW